MSMRTNIIVCTLFAILSCSPCMGQTVAAISDTGMVSLSLDLLRHIPSADGTSLHR